MIIQCDTMKNYVEILRRICSLLREETEGLTEKEASRKPAPDKWCIKEIVWHLADGEEEVFIIRLKRILKESRPFLYLHDQDKAAAERNYREKDLTKGIEKFCTQRQKSLEIIQSATPEDWQRMGSHETLGVITFEDIVKKMVEHDAKHLEQIRKLREKG